MPIKNNSDEFKRDMDNFGSKLLGALLNTARVSASEAETDLQGSLSKTGAVLQGERQSSPAYGAPYKVSGRLLESSGVVYEEGDAGASIKIGTDISAAPYAVYLEYGGARMKARPYLLPCGRRCFQRISEYMRGIKGEV